jgi:hypothetical protein
MIKRCNLIRGLFLLTLASAIIGCEYFPESTFTLASDSRLPKWIAIPQGVDRANTSVTMSYYVMPWGRTAKFSLQYADKKTVAAANGKLKCAHSFQLKNPTPGFPIGYPSYEEITVNGVTEVIEHRKMEPIFYITDDPAIAKEFSCN